MVLLEIKEPTFRFESNITFKIFKSIKACLMDLRAEPAWGRGAQDPPPPPETPLEAKEKEEEERGERRRKKR